MSDNKELIIEEIIALSLRFEALRPKPRPFQEERKAALQQKSVQELKTVLQSMKAYLEVVEWAMGPDEKEDAGNF